MLATLIVVVALKLAATAMVIAGVGASIYAAAEGIDLLNTLGYEATSGVIVEEEPYGFHPFGVHHGALTVEHDAGTTRIPSPPPGFDVGDSITFYLDPDDPSKPPALTQPGTHGSRSALGVVAAVALLVVGRSMFRWAEARTPKFRHSPGT